MRPPRGATSSSVSRRREKRPLWNRGERCACAPASRARAQAGAIRRANRAPPRNARGRAQARTRTLRAKQGSAARGGPASLSRRWRRSTRRTGRGGGSGFRAGPGALPGWRGAGVSPFRRGWRAGLLPLPFRAGAENDAWGADGRGAPALPRLARAGVCRRNRARDTRAAAKRARPGAGAHAHVTRETGFRSTGRAGGGKDGTEGNRMEERYAGLRRPAVRRPGSPWQAQGSEGARPESCLKPPQHMQPAHEDHDRT